MLRKFEFSFHPRASTVFFVSLFSFIVLQYSETSACTGGWLQVAFVDSTKHYIRILRKDVRCICL